MKFAIKALIAGIWGSMAEEVIPVACSQEAFLHARAATVEAV